MYKIKNLISDFKGLFERVVPKFIRRPLVVIVLIAGFYGILWLLQLTILSGANLPSALNTVLQLLWRVLFLGYDLAVRFGMSGIVAVIMLLVYWFLIASLLGSNMGQSSLKAKVALLVLLLFIVFVTGVV
ncbi:hypothetical protein [Culicoidibacter larvae]|uniref:Uncharacterized protein n=1 Tax=Culicoidibacter larvae TaxID=2579976 RepID=A0A5R8Q6M0_9FIRM|nr:hypothetical protein [Culicoidibacter larvae]TLG71072.1 hypothetical protein FEZ08_11715 [Culicoidibacter larvae]